MVGEPDAWWAAGWATRWTARWTCAFALLLPPCDVGLDQQGRVHDHGLAGAFAISEGVYMALPFLALLTTGFLWVGSLSLREALGRAS